MTAREPEFMLVPKEFYDMLMGLPDGADVTEFFEFEDPQWEGFTFTWALPTGAAPGAAEPE